MKAAFTALGIVAGSFLGYLVSFPLMVPLGYVLTFNSYEDMIPPMLVAIAIGGVAGGVLGFRRGR